jgi:hypothetical protein
VKIVDVVTGREMPAPKSKLEEMLEKALKNNPDLRVAASKAQEAEAELNRTRLEVTRKIVRAHATLEAARAGVTSAEQRLAEIRKLNANGRIPPTEVQPAEKDLATAKAELATAEGEVTYLTGEPTFKFQSIRINTGGEFLFSRPIEIYGLDRPVAAPQNEGEFRTQHLRLSVIGAASKPPEEMASHLRDALDTFVSGDHKDVPLSKLLKEFEKSYQLTFIVRLDGADPQVNLHLIDQPLGAVFQAIADQTNVQFVVRDYGILVVGPNRALPADAIPVHDFWKAPPAADITKPDAKQPAK